MKKSAVYIWPFFLSQSLFGNIDTIHVDGRVAAFYPQSSLFREIYGNCQVDYEVEIGKIFLKKLRSMGSC